MIWWQVLVMAFAGGVVGGLVVYYLSDRRKRE
jgi:membrane protein YqaA with SNARE-associated domain